VIRTKKRRAQKAERLVRGDALSRMYLEVLDQEFQLRGTDRPFKISTWQLRGEPSKVGKQKKIRFTEEDARGVPEGILSKNLLRLISS
jgi:hypothetical protein